jgi:hypothetical protein
MLALGVALHTSKTRAALLEASRSCAVGLPHQAVGHFQAWVWPPFSAGERGPTQTCPAAAIGTSSVAGQEADCSADGPLVGLTTAMYAIFLLQLALFYGLMWVAFWAFHQRPYVPFRWGAMQLLLSRAA